MRVHKLKIKKEYADANIAGVKRWECRKNDRGYKVGDLVKFVCVDDKGEHIQHEINENIYYIKYILENFVGLAKDYIIISIDKIKED